MLSLRYVSKQFAAHQQGQPPVPVLNDLSLDVRAGHISTLLGPSGCGKTTLLRIIAGLERPDAGHLSFQGETWFDHEKGIFVPPQRRRIGLVFQSYAVWPHMDVFDNVAYPLRNQKLGASAIRQRVLKTLARVGLDGLEHRAPHQLSGGQQQRVAMARALAAEPSLLLLDEPFSNLDAGLRQRLRLELKEIQAELGLTVILVTHDQEDAFALSDQISLLQAGMVLQTGTAEQLHDAPASPFVHDFVGKSSQLLAVARAGSRGGWVRGEIGDALVDIAVADAAALVPGCPLVLRVRPSEVRLDRTGDGPRAVVSHTIFAGDRYETHVRFSDGQQLMLYQGRKDLLLPGQQASIHFLVPPRASRVDAAA